MVIVTGGSNPGVQVARIVLLILAILATLALASCPPKPTGPYSCKDQKDCDPAGMVCDMTSHLCVGKVPTDAVTGDVRDITGDVTDGQQETDLFDLGEEKP